MANEFIARKGIIVLANGAKITGSAAVNGDITASGDVKAVNFRGSGQFLTDIAADSVQYSNVLNKPTLVSASSQIDHDQTTNFVADEHIDHSTVSVSAGNGLSGGGTITSSLTVTLNTGSTHFTSGVVGALPAGTYSSSAQLPAGTVSASSQVSYTGLSGIPSGIVSSSTQVATFLPAGTVSASSQVDHDATTNFVANEHIDHSTVAVTAGAGLNGGGTITSSLSLSIDSGSMLAYYTSSTFAQVSGDITITAGGVASIAANSVALGTDTTGNYASDVTAGSGIAVTGTAGEGISFGVALDTGSATFTDGVVKSLPAGTYSSSAQLPSGTVSSSTQIVNALPAGTVSASSQVVATSITGIGAYATTASNSFTGVQTITDTTNSTTFADGALIVQGGVGIAKNVNISGSLNVTGLLTAVSMSTQYVTSSQYTVGTSRILLNDDDNVRFAGVSVIDSGSSAGSGSLLWDSFNNRWIYENETGAAYNSAIIIAGPINEGTLGDEAGLVAGRVPVASGDDHIDNRVASSSIRVDFPTRLTHIEAGLYVTGAITSSVGFSGDGSNLTNVAASSVAYANITGLPTLISASSQVDHDATSNFVANEHIDHSTVSITAGAGLSGGGNITATRTLSVDSGSMLPYYSSSIFSAVSGDITINSATGVASIAANSVALGTDTTGDYVSNITATSGIVSTGATTGETISHTISLDTGSATFTSGVVKALPAGTYSSSAQLPAGTVSSSLQFNDLTLPFTGSFTGSFTGDGSGLTGIATVLAVSASDGTTSTGTVNLKTQALSFTAGEGIDLSMSGQTLTVAGEDATTTNKGIASFNSTNFTVTNGAVTSNNITINGSTVTLGGTRNITLAQITAQGASTTDQVTLGGGAVIHGVLFTSASVTSIAGPVSNQVISTVPVASYDSAQFDYVIKDGTNFRAGTVMAVWDGSNVEFTDTSTNDIGNTLDESFTVDISSGNARLKFTSGTGTWTVKTAVRAL